MPSPGRTSKLTPEVQAAILENIAAGLPQHHAASAAGIGARTLREWKQKGQDGKKPFSAFSAALKRAESLRIAALTRNILEASKTHWTAAAWYLERTAPEHFASCRRELNALRKEVAELRKRVPPEPKEAGSRLIELLEELAGEREPKPSAAEGC